MKITQEILHKLSQGDHDVFREIFRYYYSKVRLFAYGFLKSKDEADELSQMIFIKLWEKRHIFTEVENFDSYLFTLAKYTIFNYIEAKHIVPIPVDNIPDKPDNENPYDDLVANDLQLLIDLTVNDMPPQRKQVFILSRREGLSNDEIAERLGIQKKTVENHLNLALKELRNVVSMALVAYIMLMS